MSQAICKVSMCTASKEIAVILGLLVWKRSYAVHCVRKISLYAREGISVLKN